MATPSLTIRSKKGDPGVGASSVGIAVPEHYRLTLQNFTKDTFDGKVEIRFVKIFYSTPVLWTMIDIM